MHRLPAGRPKEQPAAAALSLEQQHVLNQLDALLAAFDGEALELISQQRKTLITALGSVGYDQMAAKLMLFDFSAARRAVQQHTPPVLKA